MSDDRSDSPDTSDAFFLLLLFRGSDHQKHGERMKRDGGSNGRARMEKSVRSVRNARSIAQIKISELNATNFS